ncbi:DotH/IcmK family type IV secretion protein [Candidatus Methylospira mobilis]|uniref:DotH/IcmK family type IV secretion protein n=1 Tax=Candidatus Methylospira mobilis TaxID=1808979 RepID=UPI0028E8DB8E|nr:DotH/IcmK family type IV secretion protein [Candidatus Methylospira mobilis]WNV05829.1 DotH/IcmK family type IV secretion protein [Candidatus Methylospira mobilis]
MKIKYIVPMLSLLICINSNVMAVDESSKQNGNQGTTQNSVQTNPAANPAPKPDEMTPEMLQKLFQEAKQMTLPLSGPQIHDFQQRVDETSRAVHPSPPPHMVSRSTTLSFQPGQAAPTVHLAPGYVSTIVFVDSTGAPWTITSQTVGNDKWFSVIRPDTQDKNVLTVNALTNYVNSNISLTLEGRDTPVIIQLEMRDSSTDTKPQDADTLLSIRMDASGPHAKPPVIGERIGSPSNPDLLAFLDGVPPHGANAFTLSPAVPGVQVWGYGGRNYVRSQYPVRWPARVSVSHGSGGLDVFVVPQTPTLVLSVNGASQTIAINKGK